MPIGLVDHLGTLSDNVQLVVAALLSPFQLGNFPATLPQPCTVERDYYDLSAVPGI